MSEGTETALNVLIWAVAIYVGGGLVLGAIGLAFAIWVFRGIYRRWPH